MLATGGHMEKPLIMARERAGKSALDRLRAGK
jgi:hypothetical protein